MSGDQATAARVSTLKTDVGSVEGYVLNDKYADNTRLRTDLEAAHAEIRRLGGNIPEPCGPLVYRSLDGAEFEPMLSGNVVKMEYP